MEPWMLVVVGVAALIGLTASFSILRRRSESDDPPFAASTEGVTLCPLCGFTNASVDLTCASCGQSLPG